jgi:hypothetical protein
MKRRENSKGTDTIPRAAVQQIIEVLKFIAASGDTSTFEKVRQFLLRRSRRSAPSSPVAMYTVARDVLIELQKLAYINAGILPRTQSMAESHSECPCELTASGRALADLYRHDKGNAYDQLLLAWLDNHSYFRALITRVHQESIYVPDITSVKQLGSQLRGDEDLETLARRISDHCLSRLSRVPLETEKMEKFARAVSERVQQLGETALADLDPKKFVDAIEDRVVIPALLTAESLPFTDAVTFQHTLKAAKDFFAVCWTTTHPEFQLRVVFPTCEFRPVIGDERSASTFQIVHHGKSFAAPVFVDALRSAYNRVANSPSSYADAYAIRAHVCVALQIQPKVFAACLTDVVSAQATMDLTIYTELPFDPPPAGEDYLEIDRNRIGLLKLTASN